MKQAFIKMKNSILNAFDDFIESSVSLKFNPTTTYNAATGAATVTYSTNETVKAYLSVYKRQATGLEIKAGELRLLLDTVSEVPPNSEITLGSKVYRVLEVQPIPKTNQIMTECRVEAVNNA